MHVRSLNSVEIDRAQQQGIVTAFLRRGPWGYILRDQEVLDRCLFRLELLAELPELVAKHNAEA